MMRIFPLLVLSLLTGLMLNAQDEVRFTWKSLDEMRRVKHPQHPDLIKAQVYNYVIEDLGVDDHISIFKSLGAYSFVYKGERFDNLRTLEEANGQKYELSYDGLYDEYHFTHYSIYKPLQKKSIKAIIDMPSGNGMITVEHSINDYLDDYYLEKVIRGAILSEGYYMQVDSLYSDTVTTFDPTNYTETVVITTDSTMSIKCGEWKMNLACDNENITKRDSTYMTFFFSPCPVKE